MKSLHIVTVAVLFLITGCAAKINNSKTETVKIAGNCDMCKTTIEEAGNMKAIAEVNWDTATKMASITYDTKKTNKSEILRRISIAGYDNEMYLAPDEAYNKLPECCMYERDSKIKMVDMPMPTTQKDTTAQQPVAVATQQQTQLQTVFDSYFKVKDALVKTDANTVAKNAATLLSALKEVKMESLGQEEHMAWMKAEKDLKMNAEHIATSKEIEHQRDHFSLLSTGMYQLIKVVKLSQTIYWQHCPMYNDGKGADWLSKENAIKNPYYGSQMLTCGKTVETIK